MTTSRKSPRCSGSGRIPDDMGPGKITDCPVCGRPVRLIKSFTGGGRVPSHGTVITRNTKKADERMNFLREVGL